MTRIRNTRARRCASAMWWLVAVALVACSSIEIARYKSGCIEVTGGKISIDCDEGTWSFGGLCARVLHDACPDMTRFVFEAGIDANDNGQLDDGEAIVVVDDGEPGNEACVAAASGSTGDAKHDFIYHYEVYVEGSDTPVVSKTEKQEPM